MSGSKRLLEEIEAKRQRAISILLDAGALEVCERTGNFVDTMDISAFEDAVAAAMQETNESEEAVRRWLEEVLNEHTEL